MKESNNEKNHFYLPEEKEDGIDFDLAVVSKKERKGKVGLKVIGGKGSLSNEAIVKDTENWAFVPWLFRERHAILLNYLCL